MNIYRKQYFSMVELVLAMTILAIGFVGMMSIFPIGIKNSGDAKERFFAKLAADHVISYLQASVRYQGLEEAIDDDEVGVIPFTFKTSNELSSYTLPWVKTMFNQGKDYLDYYSKNTFSGFLEIADYGSESDWEEIDIPGIRKFDNTAVVIYKKKGKSGVEQYDDTYECAYRIQFVTNYDGTDVVMFDAICMAGVGVWNVVSSRGALTSRYDCVVTWPATEIPDNRKQDRYSITSQIAIPVDSTERALPYKPYY